jgi:hypothetical protein
MRSVLAFILPALVAAAPRVKPLDTPEPGAIKIDAFTHSGNGCPQGSLAATISPDRTVITFGFDRFQTYIGPGTTIQDRSKNCALHLTLSYPSGYSFAVLDSTYHGFAQLEQGVTGTFFSTYFFSNDAAKTRTTQSSIVGGGIWADGQVYTKSESLPATDTIRSPCGGRTAILNINNRLALSSSNPDAGGMLTNDDATASITQQVHIDWVKC